MTISITGAGTLGDRWQILLPISDMPDIGDFDRWSRRSKTLAKFAVAEAGTLGDFRRSPRQAYKIA